MKRSATKRFGLAEKALEIMGLDSVPEDSETPKEEALKQRLDKSNKLQTGLEAAYVQDMNSLLSHDRRRVRRYEDRTVFGADRKGPTTNDQQALEDEKMQIADDIRTTNTTINRGGGLLNTVGAIAMGAGGLYAANEYFNQDEPPPPAVQVEEVPTEREFEFRVDSRVIPPKE